MDVVAVSVQRPYAVCLVLEPRGSPVELKVLRFLSRSTRICFNDDIHLCPGFELTFLTLLVGYHIFNANLPIQVLSIVDVDLCLFGWLGTAGLMIFWTVPCSFFRFRVMGNLQLMDRGLHRIVAPRRGHTSQLSSALVLGAASRLKLDC